MKKTLVFGISTAILMTTLTGCIHEKPVQTMYGVDPTLEQPANAQEIEQPIPDVYGPAVND